MQQKKLIQTATKLSTKFLKISIFVLGLQFCTSVVFAEEFNSGFGFKFNLSEDWREYPKEKIKLEKRKNLQSTAEIYYLSNQKQTDFVDNIYIINLGANKLNGALDTNAEELERNCKNWSKQIENSIINSSKNGRLKNSTSKLKPKFEFKECKILANKDNSNKGLFFSYKVNEKIGQMQYVFFTEKTKETGTTKADKGTVAKTGTETGTGTGTGTDTKTEKNKGTKTAKYKDSILISATYTLKKQEQLTKDFKNLIASIKIH